MKEEINYPHIGQFHWQYFQQQDGKRNVAVSSTVPRVEMMLESGMKKEFVDKKREQSYSVVFDSNYVFDYFYQKIVLNMGWENNGKIDVNVLRCFLNDFLLHCEAKCSSREQQSIEAQALALSQQFPHKTVEQWKQELLGNETDTKKGQMQQQDDKDVDLVSAAVRVEEQGEIANISADAKEAWQNDNNISTKSIRDLKRMASDAKIKGYGSMSKDDLVAAIIIHNRP